MAAVNKTETISAADFRARNTRKATAAGLAPVVNDPNTGLQWFAIARQAAPATYTFMYTGPVVSQNKTFAGMHWAKRKALTDKWHGIFGKLLVSAGVQPMARFKLHLRYNSRHDADNLVLTCKWLVDSMKGKYVEDDTKKYYRGIAIEPDESLSHNTFVFTITELL